MMHPRNVGVLIARDYGQRDEVSEGKKSYHINILELIAVKYAIFTFTKEKFSISIYLQVENMTAIS